MFVVHLSCPLTDVLLNDVTRILGVKCAESRDDVLQLAEDLDATTPGLGPRLDDPQVARAV